MNFQNLQKVETDDFYLGLAFRRANEQAERQREVKAFNKLQKSKIIELEKITTIRNVLSTQLMGILTSFPSIDQLDPFYQELIKITLDYVHLKKSLGALNWCVKKINELTSLTSKNIKLSRDITVVNNHRRAFYGRTSSFLRQIKKELLMLEQARKTMKNFPAIKTSCPTVCIAGFPNVGKSTLLKKLTSASPEIENYPFTTKSLNLGYWQYKSKRVQFIDTPGTLNRFEKMNTIEQQAHLALQYCAQVIIYVFDLTEQAATIPDQKKLFNHLKKSEKPVIVYFSKSDILPPETITSFSVKGFTDLEALQKSVVKKLKI
ncbi:50S ribosome-binding GTPase [Candidatus Woesearchaeota archaeon]|nr:50S ribosome-binding GTPase [Candidatus Woesearchaeota archaeon]